MLMVCVTALQSNRSRHRFLEDEQLPISVAETKM